MLMTMEEYLAREQQVEEAAEGDAGAESDEALAGATGEGEGAAVGDADEGAAPEPAAGDDPPFAPDPRPTAD